LPGSQGSRGSRNVAHCATLSLSSRARSARALSSTTPWCNERPLALSGEGSVRDHVDLDFRIDHQACFGRRARRAAVAEVAHVDAVERAEVARVLQPARALADVVKRGSGEGEHGFQVLHHLTCLCFDAPGDDLAVGTGRHLPRHVDEVTGAA